MYKAVTSFPDGPGAVPDKIVQVFSDLFSKSRGNAGLNFLKPLTKLVNLIGEGKVPEKQRLLFCSKTYRPHKNRLIHKIFKTLLASRTQCGVNLTEIGFFAPKYDGGRESTQAVKNFRFWSKN